MKIFLQIFIFTFFYFNIFSQVNDVKYSQDKEPRKFMIKSYDPNLKSFPEKSFYKQKADWQYIIDTTCGPGLPLAQKQQIFNKFANSVGNSFDGFNTLGQEIATLVNEEKSVGTYGVNWNAANLPSGVYFYRLKAGDLAQTRKMILLK